MGENWWLSWYVGVSFLEFLRDPLMCEVSPKRNLRVLANCILSSFDGRKRNNCAPVSPFPQELLIRNCH